MRQWFVLSANGGGGGRLWVPQGTETNGRNSCHLQQIVFPISIRMLSWAFFNKIMIQVCDVYLILHKVAEIYYD